VLRVGPYPVAWRVETVNDCDRHGYGYVRLDGVFADVFERRLNTLFQFSLGKQTNPLGSRIGLWRQRHEGEVLTADPNELWLTRGITYQVITSHETLNVWQMWNLIPVNVEGGSTPSFGTLEPGFLPAYEGGTGQSSTRTQRVEPERDELGTTVNEVTVVTTTVTTRKRYRVEDA